MTQIGLDSFSLNMNIEDPDQPLDVFWFLERVVQFGLDGCQIDPRHLGNWNESLIHAIRDFREEHDLYLELGAWHFDFDTVSMQLQKASEAGARCLRTFHGGYRHRMSSDKISRAVSDSIEGLKRLSDVAERWGVPLALENHEEFTSLEIVEILDAVDSPFVRACLDTGNGMPVGEDPVECTQRLLPYAVCLHFKDWVVRFDEGIPSWEDRPLGRGDAKGLDVLSMVTGTRPDLPVTIEVPTFGSSRTVTKADEWSNVVDSIQFVRSLS